MEALAILQIFAASCAWDARYDLPSVPVHANPILYTAYAKKEIGTLPIMEELNFKYKAIALYERHNIEDLSHDEKLAAAYLSRELAKRVLDYEIEHGSSDERFVFYLPFVKASLNYEVGVFSQALWGLHFVVSAFTFKDAGKHSSSGLKNWLMLEAAEKYPLSALGAWIFKARMRALNVGPKRLFETYLVECPVFREFAPKSF